MSQENKNENFLNETNDFNKNLAGLLFYPRWEKVPSLRENPRQVINSRQHELLLSCLLEDIGIQPLTNKKLEIITARLYKKNSPAQ